MCQTPLIFNIKCLFNKNVFQVKTSLKVRDIKEIHANYENSKRLTLIILLFILNKTIEISIFYKRNQFLYIDSPSDALTEIKWFNDVPRAMQK